MQQTVLIDRHSTTEQNQPGNDISAYFCRMNWAVVGWPGSRVLLVVDAFEGRKDVLGGGGRDAVEVKERGVEFGHQLRPLGFVPLVEPAAVFLLKNSWTP